MLFCMIPLAEPPLSRIATPSDSAAAEKAIAVPNWLRRAVPDAQSLAAKGFGPNTQEDIAFAAGAAISMLDQVVRRQEQWAGAWRQRLALAAASVAVKQGGRVEDEAALRDALLLTRPGDDVGPAGNRLLAWRRLASRPAIDLLTKESIALVLEEFGYLREEAAVRELADKLGNLRTDVGTTGLLPRTLEIAERHGYGRTVGAWLVDALLAQRLGWIHAVPLLGTEVAWGTRIVRRRAETGTAAVNPDPERAKNQLAAQARAALHAIDLFAELERRAARLIAVAPKLRARAAGHVVHRLLSDDAIVASQQIPGMSDRGLRRLCDRLVSLGAVRELTGRPTFRIFGL